MRNPFILNLVLTPENQLEIKKIYCAQHEEKNSEMSGFY